MYAWTGEWTETLTYPLLMSPENYRNLVVRGYAEETAGMLFNLTIEPYVRAEGVSRHEFEFSPKPRRSGRAPSGTGCSGGTGPG